MLNTDNINITGESFDYGPWRFLPTYDPAFTAAYFDESGLYAFGRQPDDAALEPDAAGRVPAPARRPRLTSSAALAGYPLGFPRELAAAVSRRLGLRSAGEHADGALVEALFGFLKSSQAPFEQTFFDWRGGVAAAERAAHGPSAAHYETAAFTPLREAMERLEPCRDGGVAHPYFSRERPCTMLIDEVEALWASIAEGDDWRPLAAKLHEIDDVAHAYGMAVTVPLEERRPQASHRRVSFVGQSLPTPAKHL